MTHTTIASYKHYDYPAVKPRAGAIGYVSVLECMFVFYNPGDPMYSTASMTMTHYWSGDAGGFIPIFFKDDE